MTRPGLFALGTLALLTLALAADPTTTSSATPKPSVWPPCDPNSPSYNRGRCTGGRVRYYLAVFGGAAGAIVAGWILIRLMDGKWCSTGCGRVSHSPTVGERMETRFEQWRAEREARRARHAEWPWLVTVSAWLKVLHVNKAAVPESRHVPHKPRDTQTLLGRLRRWVARRPALPEREREFDELESEISRQEAAFGELPSHLPSYPVKNKKSEAKGKDKDRMPDDNRSYTTAAPSYHSQNSAPSYRTLGPAPASPAPAYFTYSVHLPSRPPSPPGSIYSEVSSFGEVPDVVPGGRMLGGVPPPLPPRLPPRSLYRPSRAGLPDFSARRGRSGYLTTSQRLSMSAPASEGDETASSVADSGAPLLARRPEDMV
ncbi:hypothetical protein Q8F55_006161 [Vanrija albida]|uniref:Transmembrane protein n=1 Tax=Vanrija albida TaxID=181172 RepID=A0ABR3PWN2_9TREE